MKLKIKVWKMLPRPDGSMLILPWFWDIYDLDQSSTYAVDVGMASSQEEALAQASRAVQDHS